MTGCAFCAVGWPHEETESCFNVAIPVSVGESEEVRRGAPEKEGTSMKDVLSTGRKRAADAAPIEGGLVCEWAMLKEAGGGIEPIQGCPGNPATDRHHGPDKSVLNNTVGVNLHRICSW